MNNKMEKKYLSVDDITFDVEDIIDFNFKAVESKGEDFEELETSPKKLGFVNLTIIVKSRK
jgi:hypothetical protein